MLRENGKYFKYSLGDLLHVADRLNQLFYVAATVWLDNQK